MFDFPNMTPMKVVARLHCELGKPKGWNKGAAFKLAVAYFESGETEPSEVDLDDAVEQLRSASEAVEQKEGGSGGGFRRTKVCPHAQLTFCPHAQCCMACGLGCKSTAALTSCDVCRLARATASGVCELAARIQPRHLFLDFDGTLCLASKGGNPLLIERAVPDPVLCDLVFRHASGFFKSTPAFAHVVTRNRNTRYIEKFLLQKAPATRLHESVHTIGYGLSKAVAACNPVLLSGSRSDRNSSGRSPEVLGMIVDDNWNEIGKGRFTARYRAVQHFRVQSPHLRAISQRQHQRRQPPSSCNSP